jgi:hypothetical protein
MATTEEQTTLDQQMREYMEQEHEEKLKRNNVNHQMDKVVKEGRPDVETASGVNPFAQTIEVADATGDYVSNDQPSMDAAPSEDSPF